MLIAPNYSLDPEWSNRKPYKKEIIPGFRQPWTNGMNGLSFDSDGVAYVTTRKKIYRFPKTKYYHKWYEYDPEASSTPYPEGLFDHAGDLDIDQNGNIWVPIEGPAGPAIALLNCDLEFQWYSKLDKQEFASWVACNDDYIYSSDFHSDHINVYQLNNDHLEYVGRYNLSEKLYRIQGGAVYNNKLYLCLDDVDNPRIVSIENGNVTTETTIPRKAFSWLEKTVNWFARDDISRNQELQGIAIHENELQVILGDINWFYDDDLILLHYEIK